MVRHSILILSLLGITVLWRPATLAQPDEGIRLAGRVELSRLADYAAERFEITLVYNPAQLSEAVTIRSTAPTTDDELWSLLNEQLSQRSMTTVASSTPGVYEVVGLRDAQQRTFPLSHLSDAPSPMPGFVSLIINTAPLSPEGVNALLRPVLTPQTGSITTIPGTGSVLVSDLENRVSIAIDLLSQQRDAVKSVQIRLQPVPAGSTESILASIDALKELGSAEREGRIVAGPDDTSVIIVSPPDEMDYWANLVSQVASTDRINQAVYSIPGLGGSRLRAILEQASIASNPGMEELRMFENPVSGSVTVWTTADTHSILRGIVDDLLELPGSAPEETALVAIHHRSADDLMSQLSSIMAPESTEAITPFADPARNPDSRETERIPATGIEDVSENTPQLRMSVDETSNKLILTGPPVELDKARELIALLDTPVTQVMLEVRLLSLTDSETFDLGIELTKTEIDGDTISRISSLFGLGLGANAASLPGAGAGLTGVVFDPGDFSVLVQALETINDGRTLSAPRVLVGNNESADFNSVLEQPIVSINASDVVATTSFGGFEPAGTTISVQPQILAGNRLNLNYSVSLSSFVGESSDPSVPPPRQQNQLSSAVTIPDGHAIAVGGIELTSEGEAGSQIPLLGDIPWLGELFKTRSKTQSRTRFYVFIRATIHRDEMLERLKYASRETAKELDLPDDWPSLSPSVMR